MRTQTLSLALGCALICSLACARVCADDAKVHCDRGVALFKAQRFEDALGEFELAHKGAPNDSLPLSYIGLIALRQQKFEDAIMPLEQAARLSPNRTDIHINLGNAYDRLKRFDAALSEFKIAVKLDAYSASAYYDMGAVYFELKRFPEAIDAYRMAANLDRQDAEIRNNLGYALQSSGDLPGAVAAYTRATQLAPGNAAYQLNLGLALLAEARAAPRSANPDAKAGTDALWFQARVALAKAVRVAPNDYTTRETYAETLSEMGHDTAAQTQFQKAEELRPNDYRALYYLGVTDIRLGNCHASAKALQRALAVARDADKPGLLTLLGYALVKAGEDADAVTTYRQLTDTTPNDLAAWNNLGVALQQQKDLDGAAAQLDAAVKLGRSSLQLAPLRRAVGYLYLNRGDADSLKHAHDAYVQAVKDAPNNADGHTGLGLVAQKQNSLDEALMAFRAAVDLYASAYNSTGKNWDQRARTQYADAYNNLGAIYQLKGDSAQAIAKYRQALQIDPNSTIARQNLSRLTPNSSGR